MTQYIGNYTGPNWSDGKFQSSVEWGASDPESELDFLSRQHDSAYKRFNDDPKMLEAADIIYNENAQRLVGEFPHLAGHLVNYVNYGHRNLAKMLKDVAAANVFLPGVGSLVGLAKFSIGGMIDNMKRIDGTYLNKEKDAIRAYYATDKKVSPYSTAYKSSNGGVMLGEVGRKGALRGPDLLPELPRTTNGGLRGSGRVGVEPALPPVFPAAVSPSTHPVLNLQQSSEGDSLAEIHRNQLVAKQLKRLANYSMLQQAANQSTKNRVYVDVPAHWDALGYHKRRKKMLRRKLQPLG